ncbi:sensor histidine kinase [Leucobacter rhizosphaerae]|uniref:sensor histidine kinase n=1 Tax=Leucobacter rhizosphaerae TaxID=2932245 RepID=UPI0024B49E4E|nr:HAMP domain-containing sensor histidine kinase [Leucobacter rhizosphaerae]
MIVPRPAGPSARLKLALSYAGMVIGTGALLLAIVWVFLLRYVPDGYIEASTGFVPNRTDLLRAFAPAAGLALAALVVVGVAGGWWLAGVMLAPLARISQAATLAGQGALSHRIALPGARDEFRDLADVFDTMLGRLEAHVAEQQRFAANASHELRTPLAISRTLLEVAQQDPDRDVDALLARLQQVNTRAIELVDALLVLSRSGRGLDSVAPVDLSLAAEEAAENLLPLAESRPVQLMVSGDPVRVLGSETLLRQMTANLVHNAIVHNLVEDGSVWVRTEHDRGVAVLTVENTGAELDPAGLAHLREAFQRGAARTRDAARDHAGAGLGLAIVQHIVTAHRGALELAPRPGGGVIATVRFAALAAETVE